MLDRKALLWGAFSADDWPRARWLGKRAIQQLLVRLRIFLVISLLSLALWAAIWGVVRALASAGLR